MMMGGGGSMMDFGFDGRAFDMDRVDQHVAAGAVEEWLITNPTPMDHPFHLHIWPMQVIEAGGQPVSEPTWRDVINVPPSTSHSTVRPRAARPAALLLNRSSNSYRSEGASGNRCRPRHAWLP